MLNENEGYTYNQLSSGKFKDTGDTQKPLTDEERKYVMRDIMIIHDNFVKTVSENRGLTIEEVDAMADGSSMLGLAALEKGLIDRIGGQYEAEEYLMEILGEEPEICW